MLGTAVAGGASAAFIAACGGGSDKSSEEKPAAQQTVETSGATGGTRAGETPKPGGSVATRIAATAPLDPIANTTYTAQTAASFAYSRLLKFKTSSDPKSADNFEPIPDLATGYEATSDGLQFTFKLKTAKFHNKPPVNGRPATSEDVKVTLERFRTDPKNTNRAVFGTPQSPIIDKVETPDERTVVFKLAKPFGPFIPMMATAQYLWIMPKEVVAGTMNPDKDQIGTGPFVFESVQPDIEFRYKRNPEYFDAGRPYLDEIRLAILVESTQETSQYQARRLDVAAIPYEPLLPIEKKLIAGSLILGVALLGLLLWLSAALFPVPTIPR